MNNRKQFFKASIMVLLICIASVALISLTGCARPMAPSPQIIYSWPEDGAKEIPLDSSTEITFDRKMDHQSVESSFYVNPEVKGEFDWSGDTLRFVPGEEGLSQGQKYTVRISKGAEDSRGNNLASDYIFTFFTIDPVQVVLVSPQQVGQRDDSITIMFNQPMVSLGTVKNVKGENFGVTIQPEIKGEFSWLGTSILTFWPEDHLPLATQYKVTIPKGIKSIANAFMPEQFQWSFTSLVPQVIAVTPEDGNSFAGLRSRIKVEFNQRMDTDSVEAGFSLTLEDGRKLRGEFQWSEDKSSFIFIPTRGLGYDALHIGRIDKGVMGAEGYIGLQEDFTWRFKTVGDPSLAYSNPPSGSVVKDLSYVEIGFTNPMDVESVERNLKIMPEVKNPYLEWSENGTILYIYAQYQPLTTYTITVSAKSQDVFRQLLDHDYQINFSVAEPTPLPPSIRINREGNFGLLRSQGVQALYLSTINASRIDLALYRADLGQFLNFLGLDYEGWNTYRPQDLQLMKTWSMEQESRLNLEEKTKVELTQGNGEKLQPGPYYLEVTLPGGERDGIPLVVSDLSLTLKRDRDGVLVWAVRSQDGEAVEDAKVEVYSPSGQLIGQGLTDTRGISKIEVRSGENEVLGVFLQEGDQIGFVTSDWSYGIEPYYFDIPLTWETYNYQAHIFTDRPIYRPSQSVYYKGIVRIDDDKIYRLPPAGKEVTLSIIDSLGNTIEENTHTLNAQGSFSGSLMLGQDINLGWYSLVLDIDGESFYQSFQVQEYRKPDFSVEVKADRDDYYNKERIRATIDANYYFGAPLSNGPVEWQLGKEDYFFFYKDDPSYDFVDYFEYFFGDWEERYWPEPVKTGKGSTDQKGRFVVDTPVNIDEDKVSQIFTLEATVMDSNNQAITGRDEVIVHKGRFYIGLKPAEYVSTEKEPTAVDIITVNPSGQLVGSKKLEISVYQREWATVKKQDELGQFYYISQPQDTLVSSFQTMTDSTGKAKVKFVPDKGGFYHVVAKGRDEAGNEVSSATGVWVSSEEYVSWYRPNDNSIEILADKKEYQAGETARVLITSPYQKARALLTVERGKIIDYRVINITSTSQEVEIPIKEAYSPNVFISVSLFKGAEDQMLPDFRIGYTELKVDVSKKLLSVAIKTDKKTYGPGDTVTVKVKTTDFKGQGVESELALSIVDVAVLSLAPDRSAQITDSFYGQATLGVTTAQSQMISLERINRYIEENRKGGDGGEAAFTTRTAFRDTAFWEAHLLTDEKGEAMVTFKLPDSLTTWQISAVTASPDTLVGASKSEIITTKEFLIRPIVPRFVVMGDEVMLGAVVHNYSPGEITATVELKAQGFALSSPSSAEVKIPSNGSETVFWKGKVEDVERVRMTFAAWSEADNLSDAVEMSIEALNQITPEVVAASGELEYTALQKILVSEDAVEGVGDLEIRTYATPLAGIQRGLDYLAEFPYGCIEQIVSSFLPQVELKRLLDVTGLKLEGFDPDELEPMVDQGLQEIYAQQRYDGGWGWWPQNESDPYISAYVLLGLIEAQKAGYAVSQEAIDRGISSVQESLYRTTSEERQVDEDTRAFLLYVLTLADAGDLGLTQSLFYRRDQLSLYAKGYLLMTLQDFLNQGRIEAATQANLQSQVKEILADLKDVVRLSSTGSHWEEAKGDYWSMNTNLRTTAIILDALIKTDPEDPLIPSTIRWLLGSRKEGRWSTTQETVWSLISLIDAYTYQSLETPDYWYQVAVDGHRVLSGRVAKSEMLEEKELKIALDRLARGKPMDVVLTKDGVGKMYYDLTLRYFLPAENILPLSRGVGIERRYFSAIEQEEKTSISSIKAGQTVKIRLTLYVPQDLHYLIIEDFLPAGLEVINPELLTSGSYFEMEKKEEEQTLYFSHRDIRDDRVALFVDYLPKGVYQFTYLARATQPGKFHVLPARAWEMYFPDVFGRSVGEVFEVK